MNLFGVIFGIAVFLIGLIICFNGAERSKYIIFFIAFAAIFYLLNHILADMNAVNENTRYIICAVVGIIAGLLCIFGYSLGPWLLGGAIGVFLAMQVDLLGLGSKNNVMYYIYIIAMAVIFGLLCHFFANVMMKIMTGLCGGVFVVGACVYVVKSFQNKAGNIADFFQQLFSNVFSGGSSANIAIACIIVGVLGILVQFGVIPNPIRR